LGNGPVLPNGPNAKNVVKKQAEYVGGMSVIECHYAVIVMNTCMEVVRRVLVRSNYVVDRL
jgi:hypothetical protein